MIFSHFSKFGASRTQLVAWSAAAIVLCASAFLIYAGHRQLAGLLLFVAVAAGLNFSGRSRQMQSAQRLARLKLEELRDAVRMAEAGEGRNYAWVKTVRYRPAFDALVRQKKSLIRDLELQCQAQERQSISWPYGKVWRERLDDWNRIAHEAQRSVASISDDQFWSGASQWTSLGYALEPDPPKKSRLKLVVDNKDKPPRDKPAA